MHAFNRKIETTANPELENIIAAGMSKKILVVDDDKANLMVACLWLEEFGYVHEKAGSGQEAVEKFKTGNFSVILMDVEMHAMNGYDATRTIRALEKDNNMPPVHIIALTANAYIDDREKCLSSGMDDYLAKPINFKQLSDKLSKYLFSR